MRFNLIAWLILLAVMLGSGYIFSEGHDAIASASSKVNVGSSLSKQIFENIRARINAQVENNRTTISPLMAPTLLPTLKLTPSPTPRATAYPTQKPSATPIPTVIKPKQSSYDGLQVMEAVNEYRKNHGVPQMSGQNNLCQMANVRLNELLNLGRLDNHAGFTNYLNSHSLSSMGLAGIAENIAQGYPSAEATIAGWDESAGHKKLLMGSQYKYGCAAANNRIAVLLGGY